RVSALVDVANPHRFANLQRPAIRLLLTSNHSEQRGLPRSVWTNHSHDSATRQGEIQAVDEQIVSVSLAQPASFDNRVAETRTRRDVDFRGFNLLRGVLAKKLLIRVQAGFSLGLTGPRRHPYPLELAFERPLTTGLGLFFLRE